MTAVAYRLRAELRRRWPAWLGVALVVGLGVGAVLTFTAGARRTASAYDRFLAGARPSDVLLQDSADFGGATVDLDALRGVPEIEDATIASGYFAAARLDRGRVAAPGTFFTMSDPSGRLGRDIDRWRMLEGRRAEGPGEVVLGFDLARRWGATVGDRVELSYIRTDSAITELPQFVVGIPERLATTELDSFDYLALFDGPSTPVEVVGIAADPLGFPPQSGNLIPLVYLDDSFARAHGDALWSQRFLYGRLAEDASPESFLAAAEEAFPSAQLRLAAVGQTQAASVKRAIALDVRGLWALAAVLAVTTFVIVAQLVARLSAWGDERRDLGALGADRAYLRSVAVGRALLVGLAGAPVALVLAWVSSSQFPIGLAARAEPDPGRATDPVVLVLGAAIVLLVLPLCALVASWWQARPVRTRRRRPLFPRARARLRPPVLAGLLLARPNSTGRDAVPVRSSVGSLAAGVTTLALVVTFGASLQRFLASPVGVRVDLGRPDRGGGCSRHPRDRARGIVGGSERPRGRRGHRRFPHGRRRAGRCAGGRGRAGIAPAEHRRG